MVRTGVLLASVPWPPTSRSFGWPAPFAPWQAWHFCSYTGAPFRAVPPPGGSPTPSGPTLMSQPAISAAVADRPRFGVSMWLAAPHPAVTNASAAHASSRVDMLHLAARGHAPGLDRVAVKDRTVAVLGDELLALGLDVARIVRGARLQHGGAAVPAPWQSKARERSRQNPLAERRLTPRASAVGGDLDLADRPLARPRDARDLVEARSRQAHAVRWTRDDR